MVEMSRFVLECIVFKARNPATGEKWYVPYVGNQALRLSWKTSTKAKIYGNAVLDRYLRKKALMMPRKNGHVD